MNDHASASGSGSEGSDDVEPASAHLRAELVPREGTLLQKSLRTIATIAAGLATNDLESGPSATDLLVTRIETGHPVLRVSAGTVQESDLLLRRVRHDLATMDVTTFVAQWRTPDAGGGRDATGAAR